MRVCLTLVAVVAIAGGCERGCGAVETPADMVLVPGGSFLMGALPSDERARDWERPALEVHVQAFLLDRTEVTVASYRRAVEAGAVARPACRVKRPCSASASPRPRWAGETRTRRSSGKCSTSAAAPGISAW